MTLFDTLKSRKKLHSEAMHYKNLNDEAQQTIKELDDHITYLEKELHKTKRSAASYKGKYEKCKG